MKLEGIPSQEELPSREEVLNTARTEFMQRSQEYEDAIKNASSFSELYRTLESFAVHNELPFEKGEEKLFFVGDGYRVPLGFGYIRGVIEESQRFREEKLHGMWPADHSFGDFGIGYELAKNTKNPQ